VSHSGIDAQVTGNYGDQVASSVYLRDIDSTGHLDYAVKKLSIGAGQALVLAEKDEADTLLVCAPKAKQAIDC